MTLKGKLVLYLLLVVLSFFTVEYSRSVAIDAAREQIVSATERAFEKSKALLELNAVIYRVLAARGFRNEESAAESAQVATAMERAISRYGAGIEKGDREGAALHDTLDRSAKEFLQAAGDGRDGGSSGAREARDRVERKGKGLLEVVDRALTRERGRLESRKNDIEATIRRVRGSHLLLSISFALLVIGGGALFITPVTARIRALADGVRALAAGTHTVLPVTAQDETGTLATAFNQMSAAIRQLHGELLSARNDLSDVLNSIGDSLIVVDVSGAIEHVNHATHAQLGLQRSLPVTLDCLPAEAQSRIWEVAAGTLPAYSLEYRDEDSLRWLRMAVTPLRSRGSGAVIQHHDITELKGAVTEIKRSVDTLEAISRQVPGVIFQYRLYPDGRSCFPYASEVMRELFGVDPEEARRDASSFLDRLHPEDQLRFVVSILTAADSQSSVWHQEFRLLLPGQPSCWRRCEARLERLEDGSILWHGFAGDSTAQKLFEEELELSRFIWEESPDPIYLVAPDSRIVKFNHAACEMLGYTAEELLYMSVCELDPLFADLRDWEEWYQRQRRCESLRLETFHRKKDGTMLPVEITVNYLTFKGSEYSCGRARDISERKKAEHLLMESEERYRTLFQASPIGLALVSCKGGILAANAALEHLTGYRDEELRALDLTHLGAYRPQRHQLTGVLHAGVTVRGLEIDTRRKDGTTLVGMWHVEPTDQRGERVLLVSLQDFTERRAAEAGLRAMQERLERRVVERTAELLAANERLSSLYREMSAEVQERIKVQERLTDSHRRLAALTSELNLSEERERRRIAATLHDNVVQDLALGKLRVDMLLKEEPDGAEVLASLAALLGKAMHDIRNLCFELSPPSLYDLGLPQAIEGLGERLARDHGFRFTLHDRLEGIDLSDEMRIVLYQAGRELVVNAVKHARAKNIEVQLCQKLGIVQLTVVDDGAGFPDTDAKGFGLASIRQRIEHLNGTMRAVSHPERKTVVIVTIPIEGVPAEVRIAARGKSRGANDPLVEKNV